MLKKSDFISFIENATVLRKGIAVGIYNKNNKRVTTNFVRHDNVEQYRTTFDAMYDDTLSNKAFPNFKVFAIKQDDGIPYTEKDLVVSVPETKKPIKNNNDDGEI